MNFKQAIKKIREETGDKGSILIKREYWEWGHTGRPEINYTAYRASVGINHNAPTLTQAVNDAIAYTHKTNKEHKEDAQTN